MADFAKRPEITVDTMVSESYRLSHCGSNRRSRNSHPVISRGSTRDRAVTCRSIAIHPEWHRGCTYHISSIEYAMAWDISCRWPGLIHSLAKAPGCRPSLTSLVIASQKRTNVSLFRRCFLLPHRGEYVILRGKEFVPFLHRFRQRQSRKLLLPEQLRSKLPMQRPRICTKQK